MQWVLAIMTGVALSAACGFRVFVPPLVVCIAVKAGYITLSPGFDWMGSDVTLAVLALATALEIAAYYIPWLDHLLDVLAMPAAIVAGTVLTASFITYMDPMLGWALAAIAGGGAAGTVQLATAGVRVVSTAVTGGLGNWLVSTVEAILATLLSFFAIFLPVLSLGAMLAVTGLMVVFLLARRRRPRHSVVDGDEPRVAPSAAAATPPVPPAVG
ncbi:MAG: DUF4126 domain-containing protein [Planctomycetota bacterium]|nr:DUF4126 domain-containing protein [Planctomycetota bacterium]